MVDWVKTEVANTRRHYPALFKGFVTVLGTVIARISKRIDSGKASWFNLCSRTFMIVRVFNDGAVRKRK